MLDKNKNISIFIIILSSISCSINKQDVILLQFFKKNIVTSKYDFRGDCYYSKKYDVAIPIYSTDIVKGVDNDFSKIPRKFYKFHYKNDKDVYFYSKSNDILYSYKVYTSKENGELNINGERYSAKGILKKSFFKRINDSLTLEVNVYAKSDDIDFGFRNINYLLEYIKVDFSKSEIELINQNPYSYFIDRRNEYPDHYLSNYLVNDLFVKGVNKDYLPVFRHYKNFSAYPLKDDGLKKPIYTVNVKNLESYQYPTCNENIMVYGEDHFDNRGRLVLMLELEKLKTLGYKSIFIETLNQNNRIANNGFPVLGDGFFCENINMANLIRKALVLGFNIFAYDEQSSSKCDTCKNQVDRFNYRDYNQAKNISDTIKKYKINKSIILSAHGHINKLKQTNGICSMVYHLKNTFHHNITSISLLNQDSFLIKGRYKNMYSYISPIREIDKNQIDLQIIINPQIDKFLLKYLRKNKEYAKIKIKYANKEKYYVSIYNVNEVDGVKIYAIPIYLKYFEKRMKPQVYLKRGNYYIYYNDYFGNIIKREKVRL